MAGDVAGPTVRETSRAPEVDEVDFDNLPTGRFRLAAVRERGRSAAPARAQGTPAQGTRAPVRAQGTRAPFRALSTAALVTAPMTAELPAPSLADELALDDASLLAIAESAPLDRDATERGLLAAIAAGDEAARLSYADWLEARGEHERACFLRIELLVSRMSPGDPGHGACTRQLRELVPHIEPDWRARVARPPIEGCRAATSCCPRRWDALARTEREAVRHCGPCGSHVYYFETVDEAREAALRGACVAIDLGAERCENDLVDFGTRCESCARRVVANARCCPHCGEPLWASESLTDLVLEVEVE